MFCIKLSNIFATLYQKYMNCFESDHSEAIYLSSQREFWLIWLFLCHYSVRICQHYDIMYHRRLSFIITPLWFNSVEAFTNLWSQITCGRQVYTFLKVVMWEVRRAYSVRYRKLYVTQKFWFCKLISVVVLTDSFLLCVKPRSLCSICLCI